MSASWHEVVRALALELKRKLTYACISGFVTRSPISEPQDLDRLVSALCQDYLASDEGTRRTIESACGDSDLIWFLYEFAKRLANTVHAPLDLATLERGLTALAITDQRPDYRDFLYALGWLYSAAQREGLQDPMPAFIRIAGFANASGEESTQSLMAGFNKTGVCKEIQRGLPADLCESIRQGSAHRVSVFLASGADPNGTCSGGMKPLAIAARTGNAAIIELLLASGAMVNQVDNRGVSPLAIAARGGHLQATLALLRAGASVSARPEGIALLEYVSASKKANVSRVLDVLREHDTGGGEHRC